MKKITLDCKGLRCPLPIVRIAKAIKEIEGEQLLEVEANDPVFLADVKAWCKQTSNELLDYEQSDETVTVIIKKAC